MKTTIIIGILALVSCGVQAQHDHAQHSAAAQETAPTFKDAKLNTAYGDYLKLKDALVASKADAAKEAAAALRKSLTAVPNSKKTIEHATKIAATSDLSEQRKTFSLLSNEMKTLVTGGLSAGALYLEYCPMANNNQGAYWLSNEKQIKNPYFGDMMLRCGTVKETIQ
jgi:hypothetical protein